jgi:hypothetical protein
MLSSRQEDKVENIGAFLDHVLGRLPVTQYVVPIVTVLHERWSLCANGTASGGRRECGSNRLRLRDEASFGVHCCTLVAEKASGWCTDRSRYERYKRSGKPSAARAQDECSRWKDGMRCCLRQAQRGFSINGSRQLIL